MNAATPFQRISLITRETDGLFGAVRDVIETPVLVDGRADVEDVLCRLARVFDPAPKLLDLIGHSTPDRSLLVLGDWVIDGTSSKVRSFFRGLFDDGLLARLGIRGIRLLGCETARTDAGRQTLVELADVVGFEVFGTTQPIDSGFYDANGFRDDRGHALLSSANVRSQSFVEVKPGGEPCRRALDIDALPASPLGPRPMHRRHVADLLSARRILGLVRRADGAQMPGLLSPTCELALPSSKSGWYHRVELVLDGEFVRVFPDGDDRPGVMFPVTDSAALREIVKELPLA